MLLPRTGHGLGGGLRPQSRHGLLAAVAALALLTAAPAVAQTAPPPTLAQVTPPYSGTSPIINQTAARSFGYATHMRVLEGEYLEPGTAKGKAIATTRAVARQATKVAQRFGPLAKIGRALGWMGVASMVLDAGQRFLGDNGQAPVTVIPPELGQPNHAMQPGEFLPDFDPLYPDSPQPVYFMQGGGSNTIDKGCTASSRMAYATCFNQQVNKAYNSGVSGRPVFGIMGDCMDTSSLYCSVRRAGYYNGVGEYVAPITVSAYPFREWAGWNYSKQYGAIECRSGMFAMAAGGCQTGAGGFWLAAQDAFQFQMPLFAPAGGGQPGGKADLSPKLMADMLNKLWADASKEPGYDGLPFFPQHAFTEADMKAVQAQNPSIWPKVEDLEKPMCDTCVAGNSNVGPVIITTDDPVTGQPGTTPNPGGGTGTGTGTGGGTATVDLGPNPGTPFPELGEPPTFADVARPIFTLFPGLSSLTVNVAGAACPTDAVEIPKFGVIQLDQHCPLIENNRALISATFLAVWTMAAAVVLLRA